MADIKTGVMKAALVYGPMDIRIEEVNVPSLNSNEALVRVGVVGICPSDVRVYKGVYKRKYWDYGENSYGLSGHEWSGEIVEMGSSVEGFSVGDRVVPDLIVPCRTCSVCRKGARNLCPSRQVINRGFAEYVKAPYRQLFKIPPNVSFEEATFTEPIADCLHTNEIISPRPGDTILIIGGGPLGLLHLQISKLSGARVIVSEIIEKRREMARRLSADMVFNPAEEDLSKRVREFNEESGVDYVIVATGSKDAIKSAFQAIGETGTIVLFGGSYPPVNVEMDPNLIHYGEIKITGSFAYFPIHLKKALKLLSHKAIKVRELISSTYSLDQLAKGFGLVDSGTALKVHIKP